MLHTNDLHGKLDRMRADWLLSRRLAADLYFDTGDAVRTGNLGVPLGPDPVWGLFAESRCDASVIGNRETHLVESVMAAKLAGASHPVLCANLRTKSGSRPLPGSVVLERNGLRIGVIGVSVAMVTDRMAARTASAFLWDDPVSVALETGRALRPEVDVLIALTHIGYRMDCAVATEGIFDVVFGGHSHTVLPVPEKFGRTWVCQGGSHCRFLGSYVWNAETRVLDGGLVTWGSDG